MPQGSILGPMLLLLYINDTNNAITSQIKLFANDSIVYRHIRNQNGQVILQNDLDTILFFMTMIYLAQYLGELLTMIILV